VPDESMGEPMRDVPRIESSTAADARDAPGAALNS
jgi:hypothetical protein